MEESGAQMGDCYFFDVKAPNEVVLRKYFIHELQCKRSAFNNSLIGCCCLFIME